MTGERATGGRTTGGRATGDADRIPILVVCTGNICRSPTAALLLEQELGGLPFEVSSAGTSAQAGAAMPDEAQAVARALGVHAPELHVARPFGEELATRSRLILTATRAHRRFVVEDAPSVVRRTFTLREFGRLAALAAAEPPVAAVTGGGARTARERFDALIGSLSTRRAEVATPDDDDVIDPYRNSAEVYLASGEQLAEALTPIVALLRRNVASPPAHHPSDCDHQGEPNR